MTAYTLSRAAESDLRRIVQYTADHWGAKQARKYAKDLVMMCGKAGCWSRILSDHKRPLCQYAGNALPASLYFWADA